MRRCASTSASSTAMQLMQHRFTGTLKSHPGRRNCDQVSPVCTSWVKADADHKMKHQVHVQDRKVRIFTALYLPVLGKSEDDDGAKNTGWVYQHNTKCDGRR